MKELQRTVFFAAYDNIVSSGNSITEKQQKQMLRDSILGNGNPNYVSLPEQMVAGINQFAGLYDHVGIEGNDDRSASSSAGQSKPSGFDKKLKESLFPQKSHGGKLSIYANKSDGITTALLRAKNLSNPVDVSPTTIMRGAKEVLKNGRKALACATCSDSDYKDGKLPSGRTLADYQKYIRQSMYVKLKGHQNDDPCDDDNDAVSTSGGGAGESNNNLDGGDDSYCAFDVDDPDSMPEDYCFSGMVAFFLWGFLVDADNEEYKSTQYQLGDSNRRVDPDTTTTYACDDENAEGCFSRSLSAPTSRKQVRKEMRAKSSMENNAVGAASSGSPFKRGMTMSQQLEVVKLQSVRTMEEQKASEADFATACLNLQSEIDNRMELARMWKVSDRSDPLFLEIARLMAEKTGLIKRFKAEKVELNKKRSATDDIIQNAFISRSRWTSPAPSACPTSISLSMSQNPMSNSSVDDENLTSPEEDIMSSS